MSDSKAAYWCYKYHEAAEQLAAEKAAREKAEALLKMSKESEECHAFNARAANKAYVELDAKLRIAEAKLKALDEHKPLYASPKPPADVAELQKRVEELEEELREITARFNDEVCGTTHMGEPVIIKPNTSFETAEYAHLEKQVALLSAEREAGRKEAVPDGWAESVNLARNIITEEICVADVTAKGVFKLASAILKVDKAMLAAAPKPEGTE